MVAYWEALDLLHHSKYPLKLQLWTPETFHYLGETTQYRTWYDQEPSMFYRGSPDTKRYLQPVEHDQALDLQGIVKGLRLRKECRFFQVHKSIREPLSNSDKDEPVLHRMLENHPFLDDRMYLKKVCLNISYSLDIQIYTFGPVI